MSTLIVCTANVCRSPTAETLWRGAAVRRALAAPVLSAGVRAMPGALMHEWYAQRLTRGGCEPSERFRSRRLTRPLAVQSDLILVMERRHQRYLLEVAPELAGRVHLMGRWTVGEIDDPIGRGAAEFERVYQELNAAVEAWFDRLQTMWSGMRGAGQSGRTVGAERGLGG